MFNKLEPKDWLDYNVKLQKKKNAIRKELNEKGVLKREGKNTYDKYSYFTEAQYKQLFTELFSKHGLELKFTELAYNTFVGSEKMPNGRCPTIEFSLIDIDTGFFETTAITGEGMDKGDKAGYKAYTGALKYFLANTFMVVTGDDAEKESPDAVMNEKGTSYTRQIDRATEKQINYLLSVYQGENLEKLLVANNIRTIQELPKAKASELIGQLKNNEG